MKSLILTICLCLIASVALARISVIRGDQEGEYVVLIYGNHVYTNQEQVVSVWKTTKDQFSVRFDAVNSELESLKEVRALINQLD